MSDLLSPVRLAQALRDAHGGREADVLRLVRAPGRVNLIGEHTDYNAGFVLPLAIDLEVRIALRPSSGSRVRLTRLDTGEAASFDMATHPVAGQGWIDYVVGVAWAMREAGQATRGFDGVLASSVPIGAGLSSSAALEMASAWALSGGEAPALPPLEVARLAQRAENEHVGVRCGLMDQFASACGVAGHALLLDCRSLAWHPVPLPEDLVVVVIHSGVPRSLGASAYNERRAACEEAAALIGQHEPGVSALRDVDRPMLERHRTRLGETVFARAAHVVDENARVLAAVAALEAGDHARLGTLLAESHASLRDLFEVSCPELDLLVEIAASTPGVVGSRMTGAGFGGCTVTLARPDTVDVLRDRLEAEYAPRTGRQATLWVLRAVDGAGPLGP